ncbi:MAG: hypothetical protein FIA99_08745 [Ruminiclostridium sp.]|nr:hypothetical protein [Ruminiclostridium sp.]
MLLDFELPVKEIEKRKQRIRDVWEYKKVDHIPFMITINSNRYGYTMHDEIFSKEKQLQLRLASIKRTLELVPDDYIPSMFVNMGCVGIENAYGMEIYYGESPDQTPGVKKYLFDNMEDIYSLKHIDPYKDGIIPEFLERVRYFAEQTRFLIPVSCLDMNGPMAIAMDIIGSENLLLGMYTNPEDIQYLLNFVTEDIIAVTEACIKAAGGINNITSTDFVSEWFPEGKKGHVSDDVCAMYNPELFKKFSIPVNNRIYRKYGPGTLHNCGPNPCAEYYLDHEPIISGADLCFKYSKDDLYKFKKPFQGRGILYLGLEYSSHEETLNDYRFIIDSLAPDVIAIPSLILDEKCIDSGKCDVNRLYHELRSMSEIYAKRVWK